MSQPQETKKLYLLDAFALIYRAYFAFNRNPLMNSKGMNVSAIQGFTSTMYDLIRNEKPTHIAVCFDSPGPTNRAVEYPFYKANRQEMPEDLRASLPYIKAVVDAFNIPRIELAGFEADDIVGTIAKKAEKDGFEVYMVTPDKDYGQLVSEHIFMYKPAHLRNPVDILTVDKILKKWDIQRIDQVIDVLGLMGDASDNIPGIKGVGEKTAVKLLKEFDSLENILANADKLKGKLKEKVIAGKEDAIISKKLATIICDVPVDYEPESYILEQPNAEALTEIFRELEFRSLGKRILGDSYELNEGGGSPKSVNKAAPKRSKQLDLFSQVANADTNTINAKILDEAEDAVGKNIDNTDHEYILVDTPEKRADLIKNLLAQKLVSFDTETTGINANEAELVGMSFSYKAHTGYYVPVPADQAVAQAIVDEFKPFFASKKVAKIAQNIKYDMLMLKWYGIEVAGVLYDTMLAHYLIAPDSRHNLNLLSETYLKYTPVSIESLIGKKGKKQLSMRDIAVERVAKYASEDADLALQLHEKFTPSIQDESIYKIYQNIEMPLVPVLTEMEYNGVALDVNFLNEYAAEIREELLGIRSSIFKEAGTEFNLDSPKQLGTVLFDRMGITYKGKKTKTGQYSTNEATLEKLSADNPIISTILDYRQLTKLNSTYVEALPKLINSKTGRIHSSFNQAVAATGRLSSNNPNLQNIPIRTERGRKVRKAFIPRNDDFILFAADYSQIELRLMAAMSEDENMLHAFREGLDIHSATAARVYGVELAEVDTEMRRKAKMVNFGIIYGITAFGLSQRLNIKRGEAKEIIEEYFKQYPSISKFMETSVEKAKKVGYAETVLGRRRYLKDINSANHTVRQFAERNAVNAPIQGSAADMIKVAMIHIHDEMQKRQLKSKMVLQVHDELVFDTHRSELEELKALVEDKMKNAMPLNVPIEVGMDTGANWLEAH